MSETGRNKQNTEGDDNSSINFRPSPNFKNMRKYLKYKFENDGTRQINNDHVEESRLDDRADKKLKLSVQPPLPPNSPPPDCPANFVFKKEIEDDGYEDSSVVKSEDMENELKLDYDQAKTTDEKPPKTTNKIMCKDFIRGVCKRGDSCIYAHEVDRDQLGGVYKFCRDFENGKCKRPRCFFVHATTSEKEHFFRTAELPEHALSHLREPKLVGGNQIGQNTPMGTPYINGSKAPANVDVVGSEQLPRTSDEPVLPVVSSVTAASNVETRILPETFPNPHDVSPTSPEWIEFGVGAPVAAPASPKRCTCKLSEIAFIKNKNDLEELENSLMKWKEAAAELEHKKAMLAYLMLKRLFRNNVFISRHM